MRKWLATVGTLCSVMVACKSTEKGLSRAELRDINLATFWGRIDSAQCPPFFFSARFTASAKSKKHPATSFKGRLRLQRDSIIWASVQPALGIELVRFMATVPTAQIINYVSKEYLSGNYLVFSDYADFPLDFHLLQSLLLSEPFFMHPRSEYQLQVKNGLFFLCPLDYKSFDRLISEKHLAESLWSKPFLQALWISPHHYKVVRMILYDLKKHRILELRREEKNFLEGPCPLALNQDIKLQSDTFWVQLQMQYHKAEFPLELDFPFNIPENYMRQELK
ncbi:MAG: DUF4292 domain-containing protein [Flavobacteriales bacterium]|nr:DUF4292 domain-containing protein [Flavobacteriales bacterium]MCX7768050.1 DUF4292 domain-containing protein [Flavobacteriales bacterium]MDW8409255.1 DUF4292 domain-containing protein [Flavobacteriales bacterium]